MRKGIRSVVCLLLAAVMLLGVMLTGCKKAESGSVLKDCGIEHELEFGGVYVKATIEEFNALGFVYGDSVKVVFSNGYELTVPYYNGYYTQTGEPLLVAYPGYDYVKVCINNGADLWEVAEVTETDTATITLDEAGTYADIQKARDIHYVDDRTKFASDEVFANFRCIEVGQMKSGLVYRSASPCDNQHNRATYVNDLIEAAGVQYIIDLADNETKIEKYISAEDFACPYFLSLYQDGKVELLAMNMNFGSDEFKEKIVRGLTTMAENDGPFLVHCTEGKDRTGFVCMLLEAFAGASYDEIVADYMITYDNYYDINLEKDPERYGLIVENVLDPMIRTMAGDDSLDLATADLQACARAYLTAAGMSQETIDTLYEKLVK